MQKKLAEANLADASYEAKPTAFAPAAGAPLPAVSYGNGSRHSGSMGSSELPLSPSAEAVAGDSPSGEKKKSSFRKLFKKKQEA